ncbi:hypothetical protein Nepgr_026257 [Nepenthes gracilis]|uniref:Uncharacterized protein n=1 Tax=Nepenthes gracilis TaxID=150966 RepID=A0AAD3T809_NEPGR|nr:hypothetical protein Nepgr_026257 [Nepenthes gracilis]
MQCSNSKLPADWHVRVVSCLSIVYISTQGQNTSEPPNELTKYLTTSLSSITVAVLLNSELIWMEENHCGPLKFELHGWISAPVLRALKEEEVLKLLVEGLILSVSLMAMVMVLSVGNHSHEEVLTVQPNFWEQSKSLAAAQLIKCIKRTNTF